MVIQHQSCADELALGDGLGWIFIMHCSCSKYLPPSLGFYEDEGYGGYERDAVAEYEVFPLLLSEIAGRESVE